MTCNAYLHRLSKDSEGEVTLVFKVSAMEAKEALSIPTETVLKLTVEE